MTDPLLKNHADMMLAVEAGYDYAPNIAQDMADRIEKLEAELLETQDRANAFATKEYHTETRAKQAEAKLEKAVDLLNSWRLASAGYISLTDVLAKHDAVLTELKDQTDE